MCYWDILHSDNEIFYNFIPQVITTLHQDFWTLLVSGYNIKANCKNGHVYNNLHKFSSNLYSYGAKTNWSRFGIMSVSFQVLLQQNTVCAPFSYNLHKYIPCVNPIKKMYSTENLQSSKHFLYYNIN